MKFVGEKDAAPQDSHHSQYVTSLNPVPNAQVCVYLTVHITKLHEASFHPSVSSSIRSSVRSFIHPLMVCLLRQGRESNFWWMLTIAGLWHVCHLFLLLSPSRCVCIPLFLCPIGVNRPWWDEWMTRWTDRWMTRQMDEMMLHDVLYYM